MSKELTETNNMVLDLQNTQKLCNMLMQTPHYKKMGEEGIFAIVQKAQSLGLNPLEALNGGMYFVKGKVEMQSILMAKMIRSKGHSVTLGKDSNKTQCILHGKRKDNGDTWKITFSIQDAKNAGIYSPNGPWGKYPEDMLYSRALSRLARQLFPDVIGNCYVEGEISQAPPLDEPIGISEEVVQEEEKNPALDHITEQEASDLSDLIGEDEEYRKKVLNFLENRFQASSLNEMPRLVYEQIKAKAQENFDKTQYIEVEA